MSCCPSWCRGPRRAGPSWLYPDEEVKSDDVNNPNGPEFVVRVNMKYQTMGCTRPVLGFQPEQIKRIQDVMGQRGVDPGELEYWFEERLRVVQENVNVCCPDTLWCLVFPLMLFCLPYVCRRRLEKVEKWDRALRDWQDDMNRQLLRPRGMVSEPNSRDRRTSFDADPPAPRLPPSQMVKTQSKSRVEYFEGERRKHVARWFAIALTEEEAEKLELEPHVWRTSDVVACSCCCFMPHKVVEGDLCCHPPGS